MVTKLSPGTEVPTGVAEMLLRLTEEALEGLPEGMAEEVPEGLTPMGVRVTGFRLEEASEMLAEDETPAEEPARV